jgi:hypothetical protein
VKPRHFIPALVLTLLVAYPLSSGPVVAFYWNMYGAMPERVEYFYYPVWWAHGSSKNVGNVIDWYTGLWFQGRESAPSAGRNSLHSRGKARFELLGMLDEYGGRPLDEAASIESFYPDEAAKADHFEKVLEEFCAEGSLPKDWLRKKESAGHLDFFGRRIAESINGSYVADARYGFGLGKVGVLAPRVLRSASKEEMLRYIAGAYVRRGDYQSAHRAFFSAANNEGKFCVLTDFLSRLGCDEIRFYDNHEAEAVPTTCVLTFRPSAEVKTITGIRREVTPEELKALFSDLLKEQQLPHFQ